MHGFQASDGWFILQVGREHQFAALAQLVGHPEWVTDPRFANRQGWIDHLETVHPAGHREAGPRTRPRSRAASLLGEAGLAAGPCFRDDEVVVDPHLVARDMLVEMPRTDGVEQPVSVPGNPIKLSKVPDGGPRPGCPGSASTPTRCCGADLGARTTQALAELREAGVIV